MSVVPTALTATEAPGCGGNDVHQLLVAVGHRLAPNLVAIRLGEPDRTVTGDVDVGVAGRVVEVGLDPPEAMEGVHDRLAQRRLGRAAKRVAAVLKGPVGHVGQAVGDELAREHPLVLEGQHAPPRPIGRLLLLRDGSTHLGVQAGHQRRMRLPHGRTNRRAGGTSLLRPRSKDVLLATVAPHTMMCWRATTTPARRAARTSRRDATSTARSSVTAASLPGSRPKGP